MSKCIICGNELLTGDIHWEQGLCNQCYNIQHYPDPYFELKTDKRLLNRREEYIQSLEQQLAEKDKEIKQYREKEIKDMNYKEMLELQLAKADKEIEKQQAQVEIWKNKVFGKMETQLLGVTKDKTNEIRHQVCEEIRKQFDNEYYWCYGDNHNNIVIAQEDFNIILDQIERGE